MSVFRLVYCSRATEQQNLATLTALVGAAQKNNHRDGLSGMLCYCAPYFFQCLEGPREAVSRTLGRIYADPRHTDLLLVDARFVAERSFPDWSMELVTTNQVPAGLIEATFGAADAEAGASRLQAERLLNFLEGVSKGALPPPRRARGMW